MEKDTTFRHSSMTTIFGVRAIIEAIKSGENIDKIFLQKGLRGNFQ